MTVGTLLAILGFLTCRTATMGTGDILLLLGFSLHLAIILWLITSTSEADTMLEDILKIVHIFSLTPLLFKEGLGVVNDGRGGRR